MSPGLALLRVVTLIHHSLILESNLRGTTGSLGAGGGDPGICAPSIKRSLFLELPVFRIIQPAFVTKKALRVFCVTVLLASACSASVSPAPGGTAGSSLDSQGSLADNPSGDKLAAEPCKVPALVRLWQKRASEPIRDLPVGPGDVITISVPEVEEIQNQRARVSAEGTISLPLIGTVRVAGLGDHEVAEVLVERLKPYMKNPRVELFVENYRSRAVAVMGAVQKPGTYDMANDGDSLMDMIGLAGGLSPGASQKILFCPVARSRISYGDALQSTPDRSSSDTGTIKQASASADPSSGTVAQVSDGTRTQRSIVLNIDMAQQQACLGLPARPGDLVIVPAAGQVMVQGWVQSPGAFTITPRMTLLGAVSAAGGAVFSWSAELLRPDANGGKTITGYSLSKLQSGEQTDPPVQSGDVVVVQKTIIGAVPYTLYFLATRFGTGLGLGIPAF
jgi:polysaccharide export outer membrane protein